MNAPLVSVIVPVYNVEPYLRRCVDSILVQSFRDFELILVDDGSPDQCGTICDEYANRFECIHVIHQPNGGLSAARNAGLDWIDVHSSSEFVTFIDSDDWVHPQYLEAFVSVARKTGVSIVSCDFATVTDDCHPEESRKFHFERLQVLCPEDFFMGNRSRANQACIKLYRRELLRNVRYPVGRTNEDAFVTYRLLFSVDSIAFINETLYYYFRWPGSIMRRPWNPARLDEIDAIEGQLAFFKERGDVRILRLLAESSIRYFSNIAIRLLDRHHPFHSHFSIVRKRIIAMRRMYAKDSSFSFSSQDAAVFRTMHPLLFPVARRVWNVCRTVRGKLSRIKCRMLGTASTKTARS